jgi:hypothetical protein
MLIETTALDMYPMPKNHTIEDRIEFYKTNFCQHLINIFQKQKQNPSKPDLASLVNYTVYRNTYPSHKPIKYNSKNLVFETNERLWDYFEWYVKQAAKVNPENGYSWEGTFNDIKIVNTPETEFYTLSEYNSFFGSGEFPILIFNVIRLGNQEYTFWDISR